jgi:aspartyl-tRNA(Asn)/glutamyl-tRNA(Gln) amidotransferase subunit A
VAAVGTDTGGSVRIPSALCGLAGFKPTARRIPTAGTLPLSTSLDSIGPLAASVRCCEIMDALLADEAVPQRAATDLVDARLAVPTDVVLNDLDDAVASAFDAACRILTAAGARLRRIAIPEFSELPAIHSRGSLTAAEAGAWPRSLIDAKASAYDPRVVSRIKLGANMTAADLIDLMSARQRWIAAVQARMNGFDALLMPTVPLLAPRIDTLVQDEAAYFRTNGLMLRNPTLINFLDGCALTLPCQQPGDAPVGLTLAGVGGQDRHILSLGMAIESALGSAP